MGPGEPNHGNHPNMMKDEKHILRFLETFFLFENKGTGPNFRNFRCIKNVSKTDLCQFSANLDINGHVNVPFYKIYGKKCWEHPYLLGPGPLYSQNFAHQNHGNRSAHEFHLWVFWVQMDPTRWVGPYQFFQGGEITSINLWISINGLK